MVKILFYRSNSLNYYTVSYTHLDVYKRQVLYRRHHKKGITEEVAKKRSRKTVKAQRAIVGASLEFIKQRRSLKPEVRKAQRDEKKKADKEKKKADKATRKASGHGAKVSKQQARGAFQKVAATSR